MFKKIWPFQNQFIFLSLILRDLKKYNNLQH